MRNWKCASQMDWLIPLGYIALFFISSAVLSLLFLGEVWGLGWVLYLTLFILLCPPFVVSIVVGHKRQPDIYKKSRSIFRFLGLLGPRVLIFLFLFQVNSLLSSDNFQSTLGHINFLVVISLLVTYVDYHIIYLKDYQELKEPSKSDLFNEITLRGFYYFGLYFLAFIGTYFLFAALFEWFERYWL